MAELSDAFVALPGGIGTLEELIEVYTWRQLGLHAKPLGVLNDAGYYDGLAAFLDHALDQGFLRAQRAVLTAAEPERCSRPGVRDADAVTPQFARRRRALERTERAPVFPWRPSQAERSRPLDLISAGGRDQPSARAAAPRRARSSRPRRGRPTRWRRGSARGRSPARPRARSPRPGRPRAGAPRAGSSRRCPCARRACRRPPPARARRRRRRSARSASTPARPRSRAARPTARAPRRWLGDGLIERAGSAPGGTRTATLARALRDHDVAGAVDGGRVEAEHARSRGAPTGGRRPCPAPTSAHAVEHAGLAAEVGLGQVGAVPVAVLRGPSTATAPSSSWSVASSRVSASSASGAAPPNWPLCRAFSSVRSVDGELAVAAQGVAQRRLPELPVAAVGDHHHVGAHQLRVALDDARASSGGRSPRSPRSAPSRDGRLAVRRRAARRGGRRCRTCRRPRRARTGGRRATSGANGSLSQPSAARAGRRSARRAGRSGPGPGTRRSTLGASSGHVDVAGARREQRRDRSPPPRRAARAG